MPALDADGSFTHGGVAVASGCPWVSELESHFVFTSELGGAVHDRGFARMIERAGADAKFRFKAHPHMLRHACGYALANRGARDQGAASLSRAQKHQHTVRYTKLSPLRFKDFWRA